MKTSIWPLMALFATLFFLAPAGAKPAFVPPRADVPVFSRHYAEVTIDPKIKLTPYGPPYFGALVDAPAMARTNGLTGLFDVPDQTVYVFNHTTTVVSCLRMPLPTACKVVLLDKRGHEVKKTEFGKQFGVRPSPAEIEYWRAHWRAFNGSIFLHLWPRENPGLADLPTKICQLPLAAMFEIKAPGDYTLHLQLRLVQAAEDLSGKNYYPLTLLPETIAHIRIEPKDLPPAATHALVKPKPQSGKRNLRLINSKCPFTNLVMICGSMPEATTTISSDLRSRRTDGCCPWQKTGKTGAPSGQRL